MCLAAAPLAALFLLFSCVVVLEAVPDTAVGLTLRVAGTRPCGADDRREITLHVLANGDLKLNYEKVEREYLLARLEELFKTSVYRWIFITGDPDLHFGEVAEVIDAVSKSLDYIAIVTPSVRKRADWRTGVCLDPNLPSDYFSHPPR